MASVPFSDPAAGRLSPLEWSIVAFARRDSLASLREPGRLAAALGGLFGRGDPRAADPRLETLRRIAVFAWHRGWQVPTSELRAFVRAGFSLDQYELVQASIARGRAARRRSDAS
ncbi:MAG TPA: hypothetical protein VD846_03655 [Allosphingosinicella sp.]|nr:hypothetical protein [Allosphingosinicella sp.]